MTYEQLANGPEELMTKADVAKILGVTPAAVVLLERKGRISALRTAGGVRLFRRADAERLAEARGANRVK